jgi:hypothetical protein
MSKAVRGKKEWKRREGMEEERSEGTDDNEDMIAIEELNEVLKHAKKQEKLWIR